MKHNHIGWFCRLMISTTITAFVACTDDVFMPENNNPQTRPSDFLEFSTTLASSEAPASRNTASHLEIDEQKWDLSLEQEQKPASRGSLLTTLDSKEAGVMGFSYNTGDELKSPLAADNNISFTFSHDELTATGTPIRWNSITKENLDVYAYSPKNIDGLSVKSDDSPTLTYNVPETITDQNDIIVAKWANTPGVDYKEQTIPLNFSHVLSAVRLRVGFACTVKSVEISGVYGTGTYDFATGSWDTERYSNEPDTETPDAPPAEASYKITFEDGKVCSEGANLNSGESTMMLLPQTLPASAKITLITQTPEGEETLTAGIGNLKWRQGKLITYTLYEGQPPSVIYFDLAAGNITIDAKGYNGARFENGVKTEVKGTHNANNSYYVYQSTESNRNSVGVIDGAFVRPPYGTVMSPDGTQEWRDFIVNNTDVDAVIDAWHKGSDDVAQAAGRTYTENHIRINGELTCNLTIDNVYSAYQPPKPRERSTAGISFIPSGSKSRLTINMMGENRLGSIHYQNNTDGNQIIFEGSGSLTVADVDGKKSDTVDEGDEYFGLDSGEGYISNHWASVIGGKDNQDGEDSRGIVINSGRIFAGSTAAENCSAIGGGGNGIGIVTINGGIVTAVATTTGTAIGGGIGFQKDGGIGVVTINGGNVYAYNHANRWKIPSSAIGGAGSSEAKGSKGTITITDGSVYAVSALGTAIGGGSSYTNVGGAANVTITGGEIIAKTLADGSACIGGGTAFTIGIPSDYKIMALVTRPNGFPEAEWNRLGTVGHWEGWDNTDEFRNGCKIDDYFRIIGPATDTDNIHELIYRCTNNSGRLEGNCVEHIVSGVSKSKGFNGGSANINISGTPIIRTGSIGGGGTRDSRGRIGNATINVSGGDIQAQFILAAGTEEEVSPTFTMTGGTIRNSNTADIEYLHVRKDGGAVYLEDGTVDIQKGTITKCSAEHGGAVYIKGTSNSSFKMSGGSIIKNSSSIHGGAIYMESGDVNLIGGKITDNFTVAGNGGGIYINGGNLDIPYASSVELRKNSAQEELRDNKLEGGYGGAIYITSSATNVKANIAGGTIFGNTSDNKGGGLCVDMNTSDFLADVIIGVKDGADDSPLITKNSTLMQGGGLYARGTNARITMNSGSIIDNQVSQYVTNENVTNELGSVTLNGGNVTHNVVTFHANYTIGSNPEETSIQRIVTSTNSQLVVPVFTRTGYRLAGWNTRPGGNGTDYHNGQIMSISSNIHLYAKWVPNV